MRYEAHFDLGTIDMGPLGRCPTGYQCSVDAPDAETAERLAREKGVEFDSKCETARLTLTPLTLFAFKIKGKKDKRRREEFLAYGATQEIAFRKVRRLPAVQRFGGLSPEVLAVREV